MRVLYTLPVYLAYRAGVPLADATWWISLGCYVLIAFLILLWCARHLPLVWAAPLAIGLAHVPPLRFVAQLSTADATALLVTSAGLYLLLEKRSLLPAAILLTTSVAARTDSIILVVFLIIAITFFDEPRARPRLRFAGIWLATTVGLYYALNSYADNYGWWPLFQLSFLQKEILPSQVDTAVDWGVYLDVLLREVRGIGPSYLLVYGGFALTGVHLWRRSPASAKLRRYGIALVALLAAFAARTLLYPTLSNGYETQRIYVLFTVAVPLILLSMLATVLAPRTKTDAV